MTAVLAVGLLVLGSVALFMLLAVIARLLVPFMEWLIK